MVAQSTGLPLKVGDASNQGNMLERFMPGAVAIGDILEREGYTNVLMIGSDAEFGNRKPFYLLHGNYEICDYYWALDEGLIPPDYKEWWGHEDLKLFDFAKKKATELAKEDGSFNLTLLTAVTHFPDGYLCEACDDKFDSQYANVVNCSNNLVYDFVQWVQSQEWGKDTVIVLSGDHLYMESDYFSNKFFTDADCNSL